MTNPAKIKGAAALTGVTTRYIVGREGGTTFVATSACEVTTVSRLGACTDVLGVPLRIYCAVRSFERTTSGLGRFSIILVSATKQGFEGGRCMRSLGGIVSFRGRVRAFLILSLASGRGSVRRVCGRFSVVSVSGLVFAGTSRASACNSVCGVVRGCGGNTTCVAGKRSIPSSVLVTKPRTVMGRLVKGGG